MVIDIDDAGKVRMVYADSMRSILDEGMPSLIRASHVEMNADFRWEADLSPVGGPVLGPFDFRSDAIAAEVNWLESNILGVVKVAAVGVEAGS